MILRITGIIPLIPGYQTTQKVMYTLIEPSDSSRAPDLPGEAVLRGAVTATAHPRCTRPLGAVLRHFVVVGDRGERGPFGSAAAPEAFAEAIPPPIFLLGRDQTYLDRDRTHLLGTRAPGPARPGGLRSARNRSLA